MINSQVLSGSQGLSDMINFDFITGVKVQEGLKVQQSQASALKQITPTIQDSQFVRNPIQQTRPIVKPLQSLIPIQRPITTQPTALKPWIPFVPWLTNEEDRRRRRKRKGKRVQKKKADWYVPEQTPFKVLAPSSKSGSNFQYWGSARDMKQLGRGWY